MTLPLNSELGTLKFLSIYYYYDQPCLFSCENQEGQLFLGLWVDTFHLGDLFLYAPVSAERLQAFQEGRIEVRTAFEHTESGSIFKVMLPYADQPASAIRILCEELDKQDLPDPGITLPIKESTEAQELSQHDKDDLSRMLECAMAANQSPKRIRAILFAIKAKPDYEENAITDGIIRYQITAAEKYLAKAEAETETTT